MAVRGDELVADVVFAEGFFHLVGALVIEDVECWSCTVGAKLFVEVDPRVCDFLGLAVGNGLG